jgi:cardiolipin synthase
MTSDDNNSLVGACSNLVGQVAANPSLADAIVSALASGTLTANTGPLGISNILKGAPGGHYIKEFLKSWKLNGSHLSATDVCVIVKSSLACYRLALSRSHEVDAVWTGPDLKKSEMRRTEPVINEIISSAENELLIVGYWLVTNTTQIKSLIEKLVQKSRAGIRIRFVFDPGEKSKGSDNFEALKKLWPSGKEGTPHEVYTWSKHMTEIKSKNGFQYDRKLHAKVIVADRNNALITSANLTHAGLLENLEMGLSIKGLMAGGVVRHFDLLIDEGILVAR